MAVKNTDKGTAETARIAGGAGKMEDYESGLKSYGTAVTFVQKGDYKSAKEILDVLVQQFPEEPELVERSRSYLRICDQRMAPAEPAPQSLDDRYYRSVVLANNGSFDEALSMLNECVREEPQSVRCLYSRACVHGLMGQADAAVTDLRQAIAYDPKVRFQAVNDSDFEKIREEPSFIDIIEPTPTGV